ncbi:precorrin-8X methylmutase [Faunimonas pinastri]|uniref:precorrin-8X methylmutase n=1 Tax=Faunimonas pinastri TaxID=1855383 RepID=UPI003D1745A9
MAPPSKPTRSRPPSRPPYDYIRAPGEITRRSFEIIRSELDVSALPPDVAPLALRVVHASGMPEVAADLVSSAGAGQAGLGALAAGAPILCDVRMVAAGIMQARLTAGNEVVVALDQPGAAKLAAETSLTRTAAGLERLAERFDGAIVVIGNAPTALFRLLELVAEGAPRPALVLGFPVGFVGAAESKAALAANEFGIPFIALNGRRGGSAMASAAVNALILGGADA